MALFSQNVDSMDLSYSSATRPNSVPVPAGSIVSVQAVQLSKPYRDYSDLKEVLASRSP